MDRKQFLRNVALGSLSLASGMGFSGCMDESTKLKNWAWVTDTEGSPEVWKERLAKLKEQGIDAILPSNNFENIIPAAQANDVEVHAWKVSLQRGGDKWAHENHPEWFMVNRKGESSLTKPAYVDYYKWLCPSRPPVREYLLQEIKEQIEYSELQSIHLDYIRYPDVILPITLQPTYDIVQDKEYAEYDYCYCEVCRENFKEEHGIDPIELEDPAQTEEWLQYRYDQVTELVNEIAGMVHQQNRKLSAAVFPTPDIARALVRQNWPDWNLDAVLPMMYHNFYDEPVSWITEAVKACYAELPRSAHLYSGLYVPSLSDQEISEAFTYAKDAGANGISLFTDTAMTKAHWESFAKVLRQ